MLDQLESLRLSLLKAVSDAASMGELEEIETKFLGRKGELTAILRQLGTIPVEERKVVGSRANEVKMEGEAAIADRRQVFATSAHAEIADTDWADVTEPGVRPPKGHLHPVSQAIREITKIFDHVGFSRVRHPEVDWDWFAFESLNMPKEHPARDEWETFFVDAPETKQGRMVLTPHTSNSQVRELLLGELPIRMINIAKCYRRQIDVTHVPVFHQFEGLYVDKDVSITHLRGVLDYFAKSYFGPDRVTRLRPHHFRFTEPSFEIDVSCGVCGGTGLLNGAKCRTCKRGWLELGGAGMVHPNVLKAGGVDPKVYSGFAFGWGIERTASMKSGTKLDDIRILYKNDIRFLEQF
ncbi:MAG: phenylalanine--tRNA ligase subunit alpha [Candidatus Uhrbacteria bacterium]|nr:phenylalanine--tRNA ligase subunit alpha [Candidatus Uhrbacteria bacterium]